ncbi:MAG TPA: hypothetical protein VIH59_25215 [Candidatus Tectomicrobia bacterium]
MLEVIKQDPDLCKIPVVVLTASSPEQNLAECYAGGQTAISQRPQIPKTLCGLSKDSPTTGARL